MRSSIPKVLHPLAGRPLIDYPLALVQRLGVQKKIVVIGHAGQAVKRAVGKTKGLTFVTQHQQKGTAHAVGMTQKVLRNFEGDLLILYGDVPLLRESTLRRLIATYKKEEAALGLLTAFVENPTGYGRILRARNGFVRGIVEEKEATPEEKGIREINTGVMIVEAGSLFEALRQIQKSRVTQEFYLTDLVRHFVSEGLKVAAVPAGEEEAWGVNNPMELARAEGVLRQRIVEGWINRGVRFIDPERSTLDEEVVIGEGTEVAPNCTLLGKTRVGRSVRIETGVVLRSAVIGDHVHLKPYTVVTESRIASGAVIGPFAHIRPGSVIGEKAHIGNFVETKKTVIGKGSKANHLTYLGDAVIGRDVNVGAGTITCNYDGFAKHKTILADGVFVGSDTQFVAPVKIGKGGWIGAGTTVTKNVPAGSLAISRVEQNNILNWKKKRKK
ncbi:MAG: bifunctional UDP-N-acetylglucosamine diphosphorylase/glucosamine-1-phosphate N-acetyltransferase GlmU [Deltaproteobacteria bacterium]|nr:bifunctional UDP-N-acetylglucosamine diphosphorylase/glucosamine-1-phosphate N-acetyltransferase GlmU [Deltaproteobacteria bacterium]